MATNAQRAQAIVGAVINGTASNAQINRVGVAIALLSDRSAEYDAMSDGQKAEFVVRHYRDSTIALVRRADVITAERAAQSSAETDLPETP